MRSTIGRFLQGRIGYLVHRNTTQWVRYDLLQLFGKQGTILRADRAVVALDPGGSADVSPESPHQLWATAGQQTVATAP